MPSLEETLEALIEAGKRRGHVTYEEVHEAFAGRAADPEALDKLLRLLEDAGVEVIDAD
jgi:RNA polymerase primary sigma factor